MTTFQQSEPQSVSPRDNSEKIKAYKSMRYFLNIDESRQKERNRYPKRKESNKRYQKMIEKAETP